MENRKRKVTFQCDHCQHIWTAETWLVVDEQKDPEAVQMVCDGIFFTHVCPECGEKYEFVCPTIYYDSEKLVMICLVDSVIEIAATQSIINTIATKLNVDIAKAHVRLATTINEFREKIMLLHDNLDDRVIELMKLWAIETIRSEGFNQIFEETRCAVNKKTGKICIDFIGDEPRCIEIERNFYNRYSKKMIEVLNQESTPLEVNFDWAIQFAEMHDC